LRAPRRLAESSSGAARCREGATGYNARDRFARIGPTGRQHMPDLKTLLLICAVLLWACVQYGLMAWAIRDLVRRPRVRGDNKILWGMLILTVPVIGALFYTAVAPMTPIARTPRLIVPQRRLAAHDDTAA
jgi:hypothetical protein